MLSALHWGVGLSSVSTGSSRAVLAMELALRAHVRFSIISTEDPLVFSGESCPPEFNSHRFCHFFSTLRDLRQAIPPPVCTLPHCFGWSNHHVCVICKLDVIWLEYCCTVEDQQCEQQRAENTPLGHPVALNYPSQKVQDSVADWGVQDQQSQPSYSECWWSSSPCHFVLQTICRRDAVYLEGRFHCSDDGLYALQHMLYVPLCWKWPCFLLLWWPGTCWPLLSGHHPIWSQCFRFSAASAVIHGF